MTAKEQLRWTLIAALVFLGIGGWFLHLRVHPPNAAAQNWVPFLSGAFSVLVLPLMFSFRKTLAWAYVLNGMTVIIGVITMTHFSLTRLPDPLTWDRLLLNTTLADSLLLLGKFAVGKAIFELNLFKQENDPHRRGRFFRYPNMGWWWVHLVGLGAVYTLGNILWK